MTSSGLAAFLALAVIGVAQPDPFSSSDHVRVLIFARTDCPITNRYAPELMRIAARFASQGVEFRIVYPDRDEEMAAIEKHMAEYRLPGKSLRDPEHTLAKRAHATVAPQAAVIDQSGKLAYSGRIDDRYIDLGKSRPAPAVHDLENAIAAVIGGRPVAHPRTRAVGCFLADAR